ncbi:MAG: hypothetical protein H6818_21075 [Phycisphaerales bacterium]|nr:hypothetical protein [Phycisphaerales bacterium]MCB9862285.1 hypothetical protein [Phycisphaerales bacterium]
MTRRMNLILVVILGFISARSAHGQPDAYVDQNAGGSNNEMSWANAYTGLSEAISYASPKDEIWVDRWPMSEGRGGTISAAGRRSVVLGNPHKGQRYAKSAAAAVFDSHVFQ